MDDPPMLTPAQEQAIRRQHRWDPYRGRCSCKWEPSGERGAEAEHARHVARVLAGKPL